MYFTDSKEKAVRKSSFFPIAVFKTRFYLRSGDKFMGIFYNKIEKRQTHCIQSRWRYLESVLSRQKKDHWPTEQDRGKDRNDTMISSTISPARSGIPSWNSCAWKTSRKRKLCRRCQKSRMKRKWISASRWSSGHGYPFLLESCYLLQCYMHLTYLVKMEFMGLQIQWQVGCWDLLDGISEIIFIRWCILENWKNSF